MRKMTEPIFHIEAGSVFAFPYPFVQDEYQQWDEGGPFQTKSWRPGVRYEMVYPDDSEAVADGLGKQIVRVVDVHKPGRYPTRVFFTREWETPTGRVFGKPGLHIKTLDAFRRLVSGYRYEYRVKECAK